jgi:hypothetical protein
LLLEILSYSANAWLTGTAVAWFQPPAKGEVAQLLKELALQRTATAKIDLDGNREISSCRRICGWILVP